MSQTPAPAADHAPPQHTGLRVVLFGLAGAGKTSLLGALSESARSQQKLLKGKLEDVGGGLEAVHRQVYERHQRSTPGEVVPYPLRYEPTGASPVDAVVMDCDGTAADRLLEKTELAEDS